MSKFINYANFLNEIISCTVLFRIQNLKKLYAQGRLIKKERLDTN